MTLSFRLTAGIAALATATILAGAAVSAVDTLGRPAPKAVQAQLRSSAANVPAFRPDMAKRTARVVADAPDVTLYGITDNRNDYCIELLGTKKGLSYGTSCRPGIGPHSLTGGEVDSPVTSIVIGGVVPPVVRFGRLASGTVAARAVYADGSRERIPIGTGGFWVYEPGDAHLKAARRGPIVIQFLERDGTPLTYQLLPEQPVASTGKHFNRISGRTIVTGAVKVQVTIHSPDSRRVRTVDVPLSIDGSFSWNGSSLKALEFPTLVVVDNRDQPLTDLVTPLPEPTWRKLVAGAAAPRSG